ncbi:unnamed protein product, partial [Discosporangium mesarthrocarpum]
SLHRNIKALDLAQAYINATLNEDVWLELPDGEIVKANKPIYGLKQSAMEWYKELRGTILAEGWGSSAYNECLYYRESNDELIAILILTTYVDDTLFTGDFTEEIARMRKRLLEVHERGELGTPDKLVGVWITIRKDGITLDQELNAQGIVMAGMGSLDVRKTTTPLDPGMDLSARRHDEEELDTTRFPYASILGKLMFLAGMTRPDVANSVRELGRRAASPCLRHWRGLQHVLRYVTSTLDVRIHYGRGPDNDEQNDRQILVGYADSDWGTDPETRRSVTGYLLLVNNSPV